MPSNNKNQHGQFEELTAEEYAIIAAALTTLADFFAFLSLMKAREDANGGGLFLQPASPSVPLSPTSSQSNGRRRRR